MANRICNFFSKSYFSRPSLDIKPKATINPAMPNPTIKLTNNVPIGELNRDPNSGIKRKAVRIIINAATLIKNEFSSLI